MKTLFIPLLVMVITLTEIKAQQLPIFSVYRDQWSIFNPAVLSNNYIINDRTTTLGTTYHIQWWNLSSSPRTQLINWEQIKEDYNIIYGGQLVNDQAGKLGQTGVYGRFAYHIDLGRRVEQAFVIGLHAGLVQYRAKLSEINFPDPTTAPGLDDKLLYPDFGFGIFYYYTDRYYAGLSVPQLFALSTVFDKAGAPVSVQRVQHYNLVLGAYWDISWLGNETSFAEPSLWVKYAPGGAINADINLRAQVSELIWAGTGLNLGFGRQTSAALHFEAGLFFGDQVNMLNSHFKMGFGFDLPISQDIRTYFGNSVELNLIYSWN